jgi:hypothetical protein
VVAIAIGSLIAGAIARVGPGHKVGSRGRWLHTIAVAVAATLFAGWSAAAARASAEPRGGKFCFAPADWVVEIPPTCVSHRPASLLAAPLALAVVLAGAGLALAVSSRPRWLLVALVALAGVATVLETHTRLALIQPGVFEAGGIVTLHEALVRLACAPLNAALGLAVAAALIVAGRVRRTDERRIPASEDLPAAKSPP